MEAGGREKVVPIHTLKKVLNPSHKRIVKSQRFKRPTLLGVCYILCMCVCGRVKFDNYV
jgi:hypothetical protein